jgi:hypothetical protein
VLQWIILETLVVHVAKSAESKEHVYRYACGISNDLITELIEKMPAKQICPTKSEIHLTQNFGIVHVYNIYPITYVYYVLCSKDGI